MDLKPLKVLTMNLNIYEDANFLETRCAAIPVDNNKHVDIFKNLQDHFQDTVKLITLHASKRKFRVLSEMDFCCAAVQNCLTNGMNTPLELYVNFPFTSTDVDLK
ncbi:unnamed protein product [Mucor hiemalis]